MDKRRYQVGPVAKALRVLDVVADSGAGIRLSRVAAIAGLPKTTALRYLCTLEAAGYLQAGAEGDTYRVGLRFRVLGGPADALHRLRALALPIMAALRDRFEETVNLGVLRGDGIVYAEIVECRRRLRLQAQVGGIDPVHSTALGKAILSRLSPDERAAILPPHLSGRTARTTRTRTALETDLARIARCGYAVERGENEDGSVCIGAAVGAADGPPLAALSISAPENRVDAHQAHAMGLALIDAAAALLAAAGPGR